MALSLKGKFAIITGGSRGIGKGIALKLASRGASGVAITYNSSKERAEEVCRAIEAYSVKALAIRANILDDKFGEQVVREALDGLTTNTIDIVVNNAAILELEDNVPFVEATSSNFDRLFHGNVRAPLWLIRSILDYLPEKDGRIINISSISGKTPSADPFLVYGATKAALESLTRSLAMELAAKKKCTINYVTPGFVYTESVAGRVSQEVLDAVKQAPTAEKRYGSPEDIAEIVAFLAAPESRWINGNCIPANGGANIAAEG